MPELSLPCAKMIDPQDGRTAMQSVLACSAPTVCPTPCPRHSDAALATLAGLGGRDTGRATDKSHARRSHGLVIWRPGGFAAWPSGIDGTVAPVDLIQPQFGSAATIVVAIVASAGLASLGLPTHPARPHAQGTHFSRHD
ncbi:hypothetical protein TH5_21760 [Thalassospira xianhensis MCCC 1A02616]|uniref:Uncharacterized protein n=2 Tax=Thalassospira xianhensis TaxID=478503 RepID=A0A367UAR5_9PROT|nr:hypothetical protein TH5_21760 [Thalassospira xianhensis MCCC 1A02616]